MSVKFRLASQPFPLIDYDEANKRMLVSKCTYHAVRIIGEPRRSMKQSQSVVAPEKMVTGF